MFMLLTICEGNPQVTDVLPQRASNAESVKQRNVGYI